MLTALGLLAACGKDATTGPRPIATSLTAASPSAVSGSVGTNLNGGVSVMVRDQNGQPFSGATVTFTAAAGAGTVATATVRTDGRGLASSGTWTLGTASGSQRLIARVARLDSVEFTASAAPGAPATVGPASALVAQWPVATAVGTPPSIVVRDQYQNPVPGVAVEFQARPGSGVITGATTVTDRNGLATVDTWRLGTRAGTHALRVLVPNLAEAVLSVEGVAGPAEVIALIAGAEGITQVGRSLTIAPTVLVRDAHGNEVGGRLVRLRVTQGGGSLSGSVTTDPAGLASVGGWSMGPMEGLNAITVEVDDLAPLTIYAKAVPASSWDVEFRFLSDITDSQRQAFNRAAERWRKVIIGDLPDTEIPQQVATFCGLPENSGIGRVDDVVIIVRIEPIDGPGKVLGSAGPCGIRGPSGPLGPLGQTAVGTMRFDIADAEALEASGRFEDVVIHEMGHVLGVGTLWRYHDLVADRGLTDPYFTGAAARAAFVLAGGSAYGGLSIPVENTGGSGTRDSHWRESVFNAEVMTGFAEAPGVRSPLSLMTIGSLEDVGYDITIWGDDSYTYFGGSFNAGISASRARAVAGPDFELVELPLPPPMVVPSTGAGSLISPRTARSGASRARVAQAQPRPVQALEVRRRR